MNTRFFDGFIIGIIVGVIIIFVVSSLPNSKLRLYKNAIAECEQNLPRNQNCKVIAIPE